MTDCTYCGDPATDRDHVIPVPYRAARLWSWVTCRRLTLIATGSTVSTNFCVGVPYVCGGVVPP